MTSGEEGATEVWGRIGVVGSGVVGRRVAELLSGQGQPVSFVPAVGRDRERLIDAIAPKVELPAPSGTFDDVDAVVICTPDDIQLDEARRALGEGCHVVALADSAEAVGALLGLEDFAREVGRTVVVGAAASPGVSTLLAMHAAALFDEIDEVTVAVAGTAGPACTERRGVASRTDTQEWRDGQWVDCDAHSGGELVWFPDPIGAVDCARGDVSEPLLLQRLLPTAGALTAKVARPSPVVAPPRRRWFGRRKVVAEPGGVHVTITGRQDGVPSTVVYAAMAPAVESTALLAVACLREALTGKPGRVGGVADLVDVTATLRELGAGGVRTLLYESID